MLNSKGQKSRGTRDRWGARVKACHLTPPLPLCASGAAGPGSGQLAAAPRRVCAQPTMLARRCPRIGVRPTRINKFDGVGDGALGRHAAGDGGGDPRGHQRSRLLRHRGGAEALRHRRQPDSGRAGEADRARARPQAYQTPYGAVEVERYVYQTSRGGRIYCPLEERARIIRGATPMFASQLSHKYAQLNVRAVQRDLEENHGRKVAASYIQNVAEWVGTIAEAKEEDWEYELPALAEGIATVAVSLDGAMIPMADSEGYREAMVGTLSFYDHAGERQHTVYLGRRARVRQTDVQRAPGARDRPRQAALPRGPLPRHRRRRCEQLGLPRSTHRPPADRFLPRHRVHRQARASALAETRQRGQACRLATRAVQPTQARARRDRRAHRGCGDALAPRLALAGLREEAYSAWTYFNNHRHQMDYPGFLAEGLPIGSGVTEAACKTWSSTACAPPGCAGRTRAPRSCSACAH
jgi:hypothetical protein